MQIVPAWVTQYAIKSGKSGLHEELAVQLYHKWPNGVIDELTYHSHLREFGKIKREAHYHINLRGLSRLDHSIYTLIEFEIKHCIPSQPQTGRLKLFLREGDWEHVIDYSSFPTTFLEHRISSYETRYGMSLTEMLAKFRCESIPFGDLSLIMDWEYLVEELNFRQERYFNLDLH
jgi:hypothetical protein